MARHKLHFTEQHNQIIRDSIEANKSLEEIVLLLKNNLNFTVSIPTLSAHIKSLNIARLDKRTMVDNNRFSLNKEQEILVKSLYDSGVSLTDICNTLSTEGVKVSVPTMSKYVKIKGWRKQECISNDNLDFEDEMEEDMSAVFPEELTQKMRTDDDLYRYYRYMKGEEYNIDTIDGSIETWFNRDGMPRINLAPSITFNRDYTDYTSETGKFNTSYMMQSYLDFYLFAEGVDSRGEEATDYRKELRELYLAKRPELNRLYDTIMANHCCRHLPEVKVFNGICKELWEKKLGFGDVLYGARSKRQQRLRGKGFPSHFLK